ncbi:MAG: carbohydrate ABC transporter permease [Caldilinea sp.]|jgi:multiple sugar transport system permease protein
MARQKTAANRTTRQLRFADDRLFFGIAFLPTAIITATLVLLPIVFTLYLSLFQRNLLLPDATFIGVQNFIEAVKDPVFWIAFRNGIIYSFGTTIVSLLVGMIAALILNEQFFGRSLVRSAVLFPYIVPAIVVVFVWKFMFNSRGVINQGLASLGLVGEFVPWLGDQRFAMLTVILISSWTWFPFAAITLLAGLQNIPKAYYEAAALDGAGALQRFLSLTLPLLAPTIIVVILLRSIWAFRNFDMIFLLTGGGPVTATYILPILTYVEAFGKFRLGYASAVATSLMIFLSALALVYFRAYSTAKRLTHE